MFPRNSLVVYISDKHARMHSKYDKCNKVVN